MGIGCEGDGYRRQGLPADNGGFSTKCPGLRRRIVGFGATCNGDRGKCRCRGCSNDRSSAAQHPEQQSRVSS
jgi:hypothetical protein